MVNFNLNPEQLVEIARAMEDRIIEGLQAEAREIKCLPSYIPVHEVPLDGQAMVLDLGGSNVRSALIALNNGVPQIQKGPIERVMPWQRNQPFDKREYLKIQTNLLAALEPPPDLPLGYCFSYPTESTYDRDAKLITWTKEVFVPDTEGLRVGQMLLNYLRTQDQRVGCSSVTVLNDTIASLFTGGIGPKVDAYISLIVGTGTNMAAFIDSEDIPKLAQKPVQWKGPIAVNLESGNFVPPHLTTWDTQLDRDSENPNRQRFEKTVSGVYLGRLYKTVFPDSAFDPSSGAAGLARLLTESRSTHNDPIIIARQIYDRSAKLIAASLAGLVKVLNRSRPRTAVRIIAEGSLFWAKLNGEPYYADLTKSTLMSLLANLGLTNLEVEFVKTENANLLGSALAALAK